MKNLDIRLYGKTSIYKDGKVVDLPFMKAVLLIIILSDKKIYSRKKLQLMLWRDKNEEKADRNLRNTIYVIKQALGNDVIVSEKGARIRLNEDIIVSNDLNLIDDIDYEDIENDDLENIYSYFYNDIFEDISFEYGVSLDDYIRNIKNIYNENIYKKLSEMILHFSKNMYFENIISTAQFMIRLNEYDEDAYKYLLNAYKSLGMTTKVIALNDKIKTIFGEDENQETLLNTDNTYYRDNELISIFSQITEFKDNRAYKHIGIRGLGGSGKSEILNTVKKQIKDIKIINYSIANGYSAKDCEIFNHILSSMRSRFMLDSSCQGNDVVASGQKLILIIDNLDLSDICSVAELFNFVMRSKNRILLIATYSLDINDKLLYFLDCLSMEGVFLGIDLKNLKFQDLKNSYPNLIDEQIENLIYKSGGNPFLINYLMNNDVSKQMYDSFMSVNLSCKTKNQLDILKLISAMKDSVDIKTLSHILGIEDFIPDIDILIKRGILSEELNDNCHTRLKFCNALQKEYIYSLMSNIEKEYIHKEIASYYEEKLCDNYSIDNQYYTNIIYHFTMSKESDTAFLYKCRQFNEIYNISHEFFPIALDEEYSYSTKFQIDENIFKRNYEDLLEEMDSLNDKYSEKILKIKINMLFSYARFHKSIGKFDEAEEKLNEILKLSETIEYFQGIFMVHLQFIQYAININDLQMMKTHLQKLKNAHIDSMQEIQYATYLRLNGYYYILKNDFKKGIKKIEQAQEIFKKQINVYKMKFNIAACSFAKGEAYFLQDNFETAFEHYIDAISICHDKEVHPSLALLFSRLGVVKLKQKYLDEAKYYLEKSLKQYEMTGFYWGRKELYKYLSDIYKKSGDLKNYSYYKSLSLK